MGLARPRPIVSRETLSKDMASINKVADCPQLLLQISSINPADFYILNCFIHLQVTHCVVSFVKCLC